MNRKDDPTQMNPRDIETLLAVMRRLRDPETGCPWDREQTFETIAPYTIEEAYEVADAISRGDMAELKKELGDLLLQVVFHARMAEEAGYFAFPDVVAAIVEKLVFRHPHVFGSEEERGKVAPDFWERAKEAERAAESKATAEESALDGIAAALPALMRAEKLQKRAARVGYDWPDTHGVVEKVCEEARELVRAAVAMDAAAVEEEVGDLLFSVVNLARHLKVDAETALRKANEKFERRFRAAERLAKERGQSLRDLSPEQLDALWNEVKSQEIWQKIRDILERSRPEDDAVELPFTITFTDWDIRPAVLVEDGPRKRAWAIVEEDKGWEEVDADDVCHTASVLEENVFWESFPEAAERKEELADIVVREFLSETRDCEE